MKTLMPAVASPVRSFVLAAGAILSVMALTLGTAWAQYPERPVTIVVPAAPGGANDVVIRIVQNPLSEALGQPIVVENRGGAGGNIGIGYVARAKPDGYTLLMTTPGFVVNPSLYDKVPFDPIKDFHPVALIASFPVIYTVRPELGVRTLEQLIAYAKQKPGVLNYSTPGAGTLPHLATELLKLNTGIDMVHIPYPGGGPAAQALLSNTVHVAAISITAAKPQIDAGNMVGLAVTGYERWPELPNIPTIAEAGVPAAQADAWQGIMVPAGTPRSVVDHLAKVLIGIMRQPGVREKLLHAGFDSTAFGPDESLKRVVEEVPRWKEVIERARITVR